MKHIMDRRAADNKYLHRDFHVSGDIGLAYVGSHYGDNGVREYLRTFAARQYAPLIAKIKTDGLSALEEHILHIYEIEEAPDLVKTTLSDDELLVEVSACPAVGYMRKSGHEPSKWYIELTRTVNEQIADDADLGHEMFDYDPETGAASYRFFRRSF